MIIYYVTLSVPLTWLVPMGLLINVYKGTSAKMRSNFCYVSRLGTEQILPITMMADPRRLLMYSTEMTHYDGRLLNLVRCSIMVISKADDRRISIFHYSYSYNKKFLLCLFIVQTALNNYRSTNDQSNN